MIYVNYKSGSGQINGISAGEVSANYPTLFTPAGFTFSIWGLIYLLSLIFVVRLIWISFKQANHNEIVIISGLYIFSCLLNIGWIYAWHNIRIILSEFLMIALLVNLIWLYQVVSKRTYSSLWSYFSTYTPISIYLGWITIAMVANTSVMFTSIGWDGSPFKESFWAVLMIIIAAIINLIILVKKRDIFFALVYVWAVYGIIVARANEYADSSFWITIAAVVGMVMVFLGILYARFVRIDKMAGSFRKP
jgi:hypothetical protein